jgi:protein-disulfide isomerase
MSPLRPPVGPDDHVLGSPDAPVTLVEYGDFECPYCGTAHPEVKRLLAKAKGSIRFVFRHFPLSQAHPHALLAAEAAEAAGAQGKFWEMHDLLYENQEKLDPPALMANARKLDLDLDQFAQDLESHRFRDRVRRDFMSGVRSGVNGTPSFFINGLKHEGGFTAEELRAAIEGAPSSPLS